MHGLYTLTPCSLPEYLELCVLAHVRKRALNLNVQGGL
jgi:hypothetical protein